MGRKKKIKWENGDIFAVPLEDKTFGYGQIIDLMWENVVYCAFFDLHTDSLSEDIPKFSKGDIISAIAVSREQLDYDVWKILGYSKPVCKKKIFGNEKFKRKGYVGAEIYDAALAEDFLSAFFAIIPWDNWYKPDYLDKFLISIKKKPHNLIYKKT